LIQAAGKGIKSIEGLWIRLLFQGYMNFKRKRNRTTEWEVLQANEK
jgi:hypothetical protein